MKLYPHDPEAQALVDELAPLLPYGVDLVHAAHGRAQLLGLPFCRPGERPRLHLLLTGATLDDHYDAAGWAPAELQILR